MYSFTQIHLNQNPKEIRLFDTLVSNYTYYESRHTQVPYGRFQKLAQHISLTTKAISAAVCSLRR